MKNNKIRKTVSILLISVLLLINSPIAVVAAPTPPSAPTAPSAPSAPTAPTPPSAPTAPSAPSAPTAPEAPTPPSNDQDNDSSIDNTYKEAEDKQIDNSSSQENLSNVQENNNPPENSTSAITDTDTDSNENGGNTGVDTTIQTGDANNNAVGATNANSNLSTTPTSTSSSAGVAVSNDGNGTGSSNSASVDLDSDDTTIQTNSASVVNTLEQESDTGNNSASRNTGGDSYIETGDANVTGTLITSVNTNIDGVMVNEFNIADAHMGDYILDLSGANCIAGCVGDSVNVSNISNGSGSDNSSTVDVDSDSLTFQQNDANVTNNMVLDANSGRNDADRNTGGDNTIATGDANVAANSLTFANNNLAGNVIYNVVNIFGDLIGDIIFPDGVCCFANTSAENTGNGSGSTNTADVSVGIDDTTYQFNNADIQNNINIYSNTGDNDVENNTGGDNYIKTGTADAEVEVVNIANTNISGGDWWLVIVNEAGNWVGKIFGAPVGALFAGSEGFNIAEGENGEINVTNSDNGSGSYNTASANYDVNNTTIQTNDAKIVNNLDLSANTGGNSTSRNTNGNNSITTGDTNVIANLVNFVNNNIKGGRLFVNVINVFGSWEGSFFGPGQKGSEASNSNQAQANSNNDNAIGGYSYQENTNDRKDQTTTAISKSTDTSGEVEGITTETDANENFSNDDEVALYLTSNTSDDEKLAMTDLSLGSNLGESSDSPININLAWLLILLPIVLAGGLVGRKVYLILR